jgi:subfamily B ATP-binding cassette protein MsbA
MIVFLRNLLGLAAPFRLRLALGVVFGCMAGALEPLLVVLIPLVGSVVFPGSQTITADTILRNAPRVLVPLVRSTVESFTAAISDSSHATAARLLVICLIPLVFFLRGLLGYLNVYCLQWVAVRAITELRTRLFIHLQNLSLNFFTQSSTGDLMSRIGSDTTALQNTITAPLAVMIKDPVTIAGCAVLLVSLNPQLTLVTALVFPTCLIPIVIYSRKVRKSSAAIQNSYAELATVMHEAFVGNRIVKAYNLEEKVIERFKEVSRRFISNYMRIVRSQEVPGPLIEFFAAIGVGALFAYFALQSHPDAQRFIQFALTVFLMYRPIKNLVRLHSQLEQARAASQRVFDLLAIQTSVREPDSPKPLTAANAPIHFDDIYFSYGDKLVLHDIQLTVQPGQMAALVGASGSGKTTLTNLLLRFYDPQKGTVRIGATDIRQVSTRELRNQLAVVTQETILFNDTIRNNIALGRPGAKNGEIEEAARHAFAHEFILEKPHGYDAMVGEKGVTLSGGQRQRIAIARAILRNAPILILDEATSSLDTESERAVQAALEELMKGRTTICIAHRLSTVQKADLIVVLDQGRIVETGRHAELIKRGGVYQKLYELQFQT